MPVTTKNVKLVMQELADAIVWALARPDNYGADAAPDTAHDAFFDLACRADDPRGPAPAAEANDMVKAIKLVAAAAKAALEGYETGVEMAIDMESPDEEPVAAISGLEDFRL